MKRSSKAHSKGCFAKNFYDLPLTNLLHTEECPENGHSSYRFEIPRGGIMEVSMKDIMNSADIAFPNIGLYLVNVPK